MMGQLREVRHRGPVLRAAGLAVLCGALASVQGYASEPADPRATPMTVFAWNDLGMHCMNADFSEIMVLPPFNNLHAQVIRRGDDPQIITSGVTIRYVIPANTRSADKSNFWRYPQALLGSPAANIGLTGNGLAGTMVSTGQGDWAATGIPIVPIDDNGRESPYSLATVTVTQGFTLEARTQAVVPTSTEMNCILCHNLPGMSTAADILTRHDQLHGTTLLQQRPVLCASCHASNALGLPGDHPFSQSIVPSY